MSVRAPRPGTAALAVGTVGLLAAALLVPLALDVLGGSALALPTALGLLGAIGMLAALAPVWVYRLARERGIEGVASRGVTLSAGLAGLALGGLLWFRLASAGGASFPSLGLLWYPLLAVAAAGAALGAAVALALAAGAVAPRLLAAWRGLVARWPPEGGTVAGLRRSAERAVASRAAPWVALGVFTLVAAEGAAYANVLTRDIGQYLYVGQVIGDGGAPYVDAANNKGPLLFALFALISWFADGSTAAVQASVIPFVALAALAVAGLVARVGGRPAGLLAGVAVAWLCGSDGFGAGAPNTEHYAIAPIAGAVWAAGAPGRLAPVAAGAMTAAAVLINPSFLVLAVPLVALELLRASAGGQLGARVLRAFAGAVAASVPLLAWMALEGALDDMVLQVGDAVGVSVGAPRPGRHVVFDDARPPLIDVPLLSAWILGVGGGLVALADRRLRVTAALALAAVFAVWARARLLTYSYEQYFIPAAIGLGAGIGLLGAFVLKRPRLGRAAAAAAVGALAIATPLALGTGRTEAESETEAARGVPSAWEAAYLVAEIVRTRTREGDRVFVSGSTPSVYWLSDRRAPTPYFDHYSWVHRPENFRALQLHLETAPPAAIAFVPESSASTVPDHLASLIARRRYRAAYSNRGSRVWLRSDRAAPARPLAGRPGAAGLSPD